MNTYTPSKVTAWVAVDADGSEWVFNDKPIRRNREWECSKIKDWMVELPKGSIKALIGRELTWNDEPVELKEPISPCIDCECAKFADEVIKPSPSLSIYNALKEIKR